MQVGPGLDRVASGVSKWGEDCLVEEVKDEATKGGGGTCGVDESKGSSDKSSGIPAGFGNLPYCGGVVV